YQQVCTDTTGHAEAIEIVFDPAVISYEKLLEIFWNNHDPTTLNRQGPDTGTQYRSAIFYHNAQQKLIAEESKLALENSKKYASPIVTQILPAAIFYRAEEYHQNYCAKHNIECHYPPKA
ncbi:MAG: peptide-methionine (S)-S-oxide reductase MsrA, partial [Proteobacteria bacterium]|nr:peptide-methionine (S)-S-oxide reductase MsrA [Pseudomonadota bacterium]